MEKVSSCKTILENWSEVMSDSGVEIFVGTIACKHMLSDLFNHNVNVPWKHPWSWGKDSEVYRPFFAFVSSGGGMILDLASNQFSTMARYQPVINGVGGNLVSVQASRISTALHRDCQMGELPGKLPGAPNKVLVSPWTVFFKMGELMFFTFSINSTLLWTTTVPRGGGRHSILICWIPHGPDSWKIQEKCSNEQWCPF